MKMQLWRNATLKLSISDTTFLIDPMLGKKASFGVFPWTDNQQLNPLVDLPFDEQRLTEELKNVDVIVVSHLHPDHWDAAAVERLDKNLPLICPGHIAAAIKSVGFNQVQSIESTLSWKEIKIHLTDGQHGTGEIGEKMGKVNGFVFEYQNNSVYVAGDTIGSKEVTDAIDQYHPQHIVVAGGAATFALGDPVTMTAEDIHKVAYYAPESTIWVTHLEAVSPCKEDRNYLKKHLASHYLDQQCKILADGEEVDLRY